MVLFVGWFFYGEATLLFADCIISQFQRSTPSNLIVGIFINDFLRNDAAGDISTVQLVSNRCRSILLVGGNNPTDSFLVS